MKTNDELVALANKIGAMLSKEKVLISESVILLLGMAAQIHILNSSLGRKPLRDEFLKGTKEIYDNCYAGVKDREREQLQPALASKGKAPRKPKDRSKK